MYVSIEVWLAFVLANAILAVIPGPTVLLIVSYALADGRRSAWSLVAGITLANIVAYGVFVAGLGALLSASAFAFTVLKWLGAGYLVYLGLRMWRSDGELRVPVRPGAGGAARGSRLQHAFVVTAFNPKGIMFLIAFVPQFLSPEHPLLPQNLVLGTTYVCVNALNAMAYAFLIGELSDRLLRRGIVRIADRIGGTLLIGAGVLTAALKRS